MDKKIEIFNNSGNIEYNVPSKEWFLTNLVDRNQKFYNIDRKFFNHDNLNSVFYIIIIFNDI